jgi:hypothetical protein
LLYPMVVEGWRFDAHGRIRLFSYPKQIHF